MRVSITQIKEMKQKGEKIAMLTAYDYSTAKLIDEAGIPLILVGDSLGMVVLGYDSTIPVTMDEMIHHTKAVVRGTASALIVGDMPFMTYQVSYDDALRNAGRFIQEGRAHAVKLEGGESMAETVKRIVSCGIPVMGHIGLTPQSIHQLGGFKVMGKTPEAAICLVNDARALDEAGVFAIVLECVPEPLSKLITEKVSVPTIGIGAGKYCDGQVQVISDLLGLYTDFVPKHAKQYARLFETIKQATSDYISEVQAGTFPTKKQSYAMDESIIAELEKSM
ncbi:MAG TPA: 3-methyl-2-oxobutanoate hydroxymethyltransferase [Dehalococcoidia bacterium]|nr:3-methyl-2-oxobutanoate hydroxymethyltransferase [Dehalococcoidia bacterium]